MTFALVQARIHNSRISNPGLASSQYAHLLAKNNNPITQYAYALALTDNKEYAQATDQMQSLINAHPNNLIFKLTLGEINLQGRNYQAGIDSLKTSTMIYPNNYSLILLYGNLLNKDKQHKAAAEYLKPHYSDLKDDTQFLFLYADALGKSGQLVEAYQTRSKAFAKRGKTKEAITQLELALKQGTPTVYTQTSIQAQLDALQKTLDESQKRRR
jgi:predicted Zn-dependent protease